MTHAVDILTELQERGVSVAVDGDTLCLKPKRALDSELLARVREAKPAILAVLRQLPADCGPHSSPIALTAPCWHCDGSGECNCSACGVIKPSCGPWASASRANLERLESSEC